MRRVSAGAAGTTLGEEVVEDAEVEVDAAHFCSGSWRSFFGDLGDDDDFCEDTDDDVDDRRRGRRGGGVFDDREECDD